MKHEVLNLRQELTQEACRCCVLEEKRVYQPWHAGISKKGRKLEVQGLPPTAFLSVGHDSSNLIKT
jgi:hypothetical protein